ncbi:nitric oxide dioxygenase [Thermosporothrix hazakensis]|uniref:Flavohemoprotein n=1 Tax=Thermosporothrix hazakensis TaxID=644383 RepID=A0A326U422_THEHA|nr:NO-inducible flavohemoprotein [Thermosporothrix hazakensis]PZW27374.1 nitric oxide dioxygenase [Thermosporothrix hazakensis]GCE45543.1 flavohemoprotein [Thermosporothrix hazakensis]
MALQREEIQLVASLVPVLKAHGSEITTRFYNMMFTAHPELLNIFNHSNQRDGLQQQALASSVYAAAAHIDNLDAIEPVVQHIAHKHCSLNVQPEHYPIVGKYLTLALKDVLGNAVTPEVERVWLKAYDVIADYFIRMEQDIYRSVAGSKGGWTGFRPFIIRRKVQECTDILSLTLEPEDGQPIMTHQPGQYITVKVQKDGYSHLRQYSLISAPGKSYYRIGVKLERDNTEKAGIVSSSLHYDFNEGDRIEISAPYGAFTLDPHASTDVLLLAGGVGITPLLGMARAIAEENPGRRVTLLHAVREKAYHAFGEEINELVAAHPSFSATTLYERCTDADRQAGITAGRITLDWLREHAGQHMDVYLCGPRPFMTAVLSMLQEINHPASQIHLEVFGPALSFPQPEAPCKTTSSVH